MPLWQAALVMTVSCEHIGPITRCLSPHHSRGYIRGNVAQHGSHHVSLGAKSIKASYDGWACDKSLGVVTALQSCCTSIATHIIIRHCNMCQLMSGFVTGSHATYAAPGLNVYLTLGSGFNLTDPTARGPVWNTWQALNVIQYLVPGQYTGDASWLNWGGMWGNPKDGCNATDLVTKLTGDCPLNSGPPGPTFQGWTTSDVLA